MKRFRLSGPASFVTIAIAALAVPLSTHGTTDAQVPGFACGGSNSPAVLIGQVLASPQPGRTIRLFAFPRQQTGDTYLNSIALSNGAPQPAVVGNFAQKVAALGSSMSDMQTLKQNLPALYSTFVSITPGVDGKFTCGGLSRGSWTLLAFEQAAVGTPMPLPTAHVAPTSIYTSNALGAYESANPLPKGLATPAPRLYYYSWVVVRRINSTPVATPTPKYPATANPNAKPTYVPAIAKPFMPIYYYPDGYFGTSNIVPIATPTPTPARAIPTLLPPAQGVKR